MAKIIDGKKHAAAIRAEVKATAKGKKIKLAVIFVGDNPASIVYINMKKKACEEVGIDFELFQLPQASSQKDVLNLIDNLNNDKKITGILVQQPFPSQLNKNEILSRLDPKKDVDCLHPYNVGLAMTGQGKLLPCTPAGCISLLKREGIQIAGKKAVIIGRSDIVGKPLAFMLLAENATVTVCHSFTNKISMSNRCRNADILIAAMGSPKFITRGLVKRKDAIIIDVGINRIGNKKICGDVDFDDVFEKAAYITPVPGGVGPMTVATLMENCLKAWELQNE
jgi:methylenetetrahydrofolate dehydrogenase (NADP+)/methenyltetrahydrofolate cyclohydrolase